MSIITPTYNHERFIGPCLESVLRQSCPDWELLVVDDGSTDATWEVVQRYAARDPRVRAFRQANKGVFRLAETYNLALAEARGELIAILEGDDYWPQDKLAQQVPLHDDPEVIMSYGRVFVVEEGRPEREFYPPAFSGTIASVQCLRHLFLRESCITPVSTMLTRQALQRLGGFFQDAGVPAVDYSTFYRYLRLPGKVTWHGATLGFWRQSSEQVTKKFGTEFSEAVLELALEQFQSAPAAVREHLGLTKRQVAKAQYRAGVLPSYLGALRQTLLDRQRAEALFYAKQLVVHGSVKQKAQGVCGLVAAQLGIHLEPVFSTYEKLFLSEHRVLNPEHS